MTTRRRPAGRHRKEPARVRWELQALCALGPFFVLLGLVKLADASPRWKKLDLGAYLYLYPAFLILSVFHILPVIYSFVLSLYRDKSIYATEFVGRANYVRLWYDDQFWASLKYTGWFVLGSVPLSIVLSLGIALLLNTAISGKGLYRTIYFLPVITSIAAISVVWKWLYNSEYGLLNHWLGWERFDWLQQNQGIFEAMAERWGWRLPWFLPEGPSVAMIAVIIMSVWKGLGYNAIIFLAGLQNIPKDLYEVATIDGATPWMSFKNITWPLLSPTTYFILVVTTISSFQVFAQIWMLYDGMPSESTRVIVMLLYDTAFKSNNFGYASAIAYALFGIIFSLTMVQRKLAESRVHYQ
jgi:multiple sugar transport system permease protein